MAADRLTRVQASAPAPRPLTEVARLPQDFERSLREKLRLLNEDLRTQPEYGLLLRRAADTALALALRHRDRNPPEAERWRRQAAGYVRRLRQLGGPVADLDWEARVHSLDRLEWGVPASSGRVNPSPSAPGSAPRGGLGPRPLMGLDRAGVAVDPGYPGNGSGSGYPGGGPVGYPSGTPGYPAGGPGGYPGSAGSGVVGPSAPPTISLPLAPPAVISSSTPPAAALRGLSEPEPRLSWEDHVAALRAQVRANPTDATRLWDLAVALESRVALPPRRRPVDADERLEDPVTTEVLELYLRAARLTRLRVHRGTYYHDASRLYGRLRDDRRQYQYLKLAIAASPYVPAYWSDLRDTTLRMGRLEESRRAAAKANRWTLPSPALRQSLP